MKYIRKKSTDETRKVDWGQIIKGPICIGKEYILQAMRKLKIILVGSDMVNFTFYKDHSLAIVAYGDLDLG